jgi:hypothetical protein
MPFTRLPEVKHGLATQCPTTACLLVPIAEMHNHMPCHVSAILNVNSRTYLLLLVPTGLLRLRRTSELLAAILPLLPLLSASLLDLVRRTNPHLSVMRFEFFHRFG